MEYNLQKRIEPNLGYLFPVHAHFHLTAYPNIDFVNPGVGNTARLHNLYIPMHASNPYSITKHDQSLSMEGKGIVNSDESEERNNDEPSNDLEKEIVSENSAIPKINDTESPLVFNERKRKMVGDGVFNSFQNAKIETGTIDLKNLKKMKQSKNESKELKQTTSKINPKKIMHKFSISD